MTESTTYTAMASQHNAKLASLVPPSGSWKMTTATMNCNVSPAYCRKPIVESFSRRNANQSLDRTAFTTIANRTTRLDHAAARLHGLSPLAVLNRGYALVYAPDGTLLRNASDTRPGQTVRARLAQGTLEAEVTKTES